MGILDAPAFSRQQANARLASRRANTLVVAGDSLTNNGGGPGVSGDGSRSYRPGAAWTWALQLLGHRAKVLKNAGIGGETSTQLLARYGTDVLAYNAAVVHILIGTNDAGLSSAASAVPLTDTQANILKMVDASQAQGSVVVVGTVPPRGFGGLGVRGTAARTHALSLNAWIRSTLPFIRPGVLVVDYFAATADPANPDQWLATYALSESNSYTHWSGPGAFVGGQALAAILDPLIPPLTRVTRVSSDPTNLITSDRGMFVGTVAGSAPPGWVLANSGTMAPMIGGLVDRPDGKPGKALQIVVPADGAYQHSRDLTASVAVGDTVTMALEVWASGLQVQASPTATTQRISSELLVAPSFIATSDMSAVSGSDAPHGSQARTVVLETPPYTRQAGDTGIQASLRINGGGTYLVACATSMK